MADVHIPSERELFEIAWLVIHGWRLDACGDWVSGANVWAGSRDTAFSMQCAEDEAVLAASMAKGADGGGT